LSSLSRQLFELNWTRDEVVSVEKAGEGNMNYVARVRTTQGSFILKQSNPWVEKYPHIPAPADRVRVEAAYYREAAKHAEIAGRMPRMLGYDAESRLLMIEDLGAASDFTFLYAGRAAPEGALESLVRYLGDLHRAFRDEPALAMFENREMRRLNHEHIFELPLRAGNGLSYAGSESLQNDGRFVARVRELGLRYLADGRTLVHGDFFPGSWLNTAAGVKVIDPEFCFRGPVEFDLGVMRAHMILAGVEFDPADVYEGAFDRGLVKEFAGVEIMRRVIGVAQLPLRASAEERLALLERAREMVTC
jgi:5-methylthioribose kinase